MGLFLFGVPRMRDSNPAGCGAEETRSVFQRGPQGAKRRSGCGFAKRMRRHPAGGTIRISKPGTFVVTGFFHHAPGFEPDSSLYISTSHTAVFIHVFAPFRPLGLERRTYFAFMHAARCPAQRIRPMKFALWSPERLRRPLGQKMNKAHRCIPCIDAKYVRRAPQTTPSKLRCGHPRQRAPLRRGNST